MTKYLTILVFGATLLLGCSKEQPARTVAELIENSIILEAVIVYCAENRSKTKYDAECVNAREAVRHIEVKEEAVRRADFDARSDKKRRELRRAQEAAAESRRRSAESERLRLEAEYLAQFGAAVPAERLDDATSDHGNEPIAVIPAGDEPMQVPISHGETSPATDGGNAPVAVAEPVEEDNGDE